MGAIKYPAWNQNNTIMLISQNQENSGRFTGEPGGSSYYERPGYSNTQPDYTPQPSGSQDTTLLIIVGSLVAIVGNYLLKPLFTSIVKNIDSDSTSPQRIEGLLSRQIERLETQNDKFYEVLEKHTAQSREIAQAIVLFETSLTRLTDRFERVEQALMKFPEPQGQPTNSTQQHKVGRNG